MSERMTEERLAEIRQHTLRYSIATGLPGEAFLELLAEIDALRRERDEYRDALRKQYLWSVYHAAEWHLVGDNPLDLNVKHDHACMSDGEFAADLFIRLGLADPAPRGMTPRPEMWEAMGEISGEMEKRLLAEGGSDADAT